MVFKISGKGPRLNQTIVSVNVLKALGGWSHVYLRLRAPLPPHAGLSVTINEPDGPFTASGAVILQTESPRNITVVTAHTYEISCRSNMGVTPVWRRNGSLVTNSQPISGTPGVYVKEPTNHDRVLVLQNVTQSVVGTYICLEGTSQDADSATFIVTTGKGVQLSCD